MILHTHKVTHIVSPSPEATIKAPPVAGPSQAAQPPLFEEPALLGGEEVGPRGPVLSGKSPSPLYKCAPANFSSAFGTPILLKQKANKIAVNMPPLPPQPPSSPPVTKRPRDNHALVDRMHGLLRVGAWQMDTLHVAQMAAQEALGVMAVAMLQQQGAMREVSSWELEVESAMREMAKLVDEEGSDL